MASRTRKSKALPVKNSTVVMSHVRELPGAVFFSATAPLSITEIDREALSYATRLQEIRREYENDDCQATLWHDLLQIGFGSSEISSFVANPAAISNCGYGMPTISLR
jgi:hypothetical protein